MHQKILGNHPTGKIFVISAPAGTGKTTLVKRLVEEFPDVVEESCSCTTRPPRSSEIQGRDYDFLSIEEFERRLAAGEFLEHAKVFGNYYGTRKGAVRQIQKSRKHVILVIDTQGALLVQEQMKAVLIFVSPPSPQELRARLFRRQTEEDEVIEQRLSWAEKEQAMLSHYDYHIINDNIDIAYLALKSILIAEEHRI